MKRKNGREHGEVFTNLSVVHYALDEVGYVSTKNLEHTTILEPSSGTGVFAIEIIKRLAQSSITFGFNFLQALHNNIRFVELKQTSFEHLKTGIQKLISQLGYDAEKISQSIWIHADFLKLDFPSNFDCIVGNPPYIRHEMIDSEAKKYYKKKFSTFKFRADIYILFYEQSLNLLNEQGKLSFICSNRWLYNQYGQSLRKKIAQEFHLHKLINMEKATPFDEKVIAYPCISTISKQKNGHTYFHETNAKNVDLEQIAFKKITPPKNEAWSNLFLNYNINHLALSGIVEQGFQIGIGIATGADKVFIKKATELHGIEKSRLLPLIMSRALSGTRIKWDNSYVINPFENGVLCDLEKYPKLKAYFEEHETVLRKRYIAKKAPKNWYKTIDKVKSDLLKTPKLLLPDLAGSQFLFIDTGRFYPHHNVYYITHKEIDKLKILACLLMSDFVKKQLSQIGIRMNGGLPRFQSQTLKKLRIPILSAFDSGVCDELVLAYEDRDLDRVNGVVEGYCLLYGIT